MDIATAFERFPTQESCIKHLEAARWGGEPVCVYCGCKKISIRKEGQKQHHCRGCDGTFSVLVNTIFHDTKLPLQKWFLAISLMLNAKKGISSRQLARDIKVTKDTAWRVQMQVRQAMIDDGELLKDIIEMDETYIGGKSRKGDDKKHKRGRGTSKTPVVGMVERGGKVKASVQSKDTLGFEDLKEVVRENVDMDNSTLITDEYKAYNPFERIMKTLRINHSIQYANGEIHTNTIEGFWALIKRGIIGQYHKVSLRYLERYITEFCFKWNTRKMICTFDLLIGQAVSVSRGC